MHGEAQVIAAPQTGGLLIPALLAFLLNFCREIVKDMQDEPGDTAAGIKTTARMAASLLKYVLLGISLAYAALLFFPFILRHFGIVYCIVCGIAVLPLHCYWLRLFLSENKMRCLGKISLVMKVEMLAGLLALTLDRAYFLLR